MAKYDLTNSLEKDFVFAIDGKEFLFRKPTVREMRSIVSKFSGIEKITDPDEQLRQNDEAQRELYAFISSVNHDLNIADVLNDQPVDVQIAFNEMIQKELGAKK